MGLWKMPAGHMSAARSLNVFAIPIFLNFPNPLSPQQASFVVLRLTPKCIRAVRFARVSTSQRSLQGLRTCGAAQLTSKVVSKKLTFTLFRSRSPISPKQYLSTCILKGPRLVAVSFVCVPQYGTKNRVMCSREASLPILCDYSLEQTPVHFCFMRV